MMNILDEGLQIHFWKKISKIYSHHKKGSHQQLPINKKQSTGYKTFLLQQKTMCVSLTHLPIIFCMIECYVDNQTRICRRKHLYKATINGGKIFCTYVKSKYAEPSESLKYSSMFSSKFKSSKEDRRLRTSNGRQKKS